MIRAAALLVALLAQGESVGDNLAAGAILVKGAWASAGDSVTPLPEGGRQKGSEYSNDYFGFSYGVSPSWIERFKGPPPSDGGYYVLAQLAPAPASTRAPGAHLLIAAQDLFFSLAEANNALELLNNVKDHLDDGYEVERAPTAVRIANHAFVRLDYASPASGLHWHVLATDIRCHVVQFVFTGRSEPLMAHLIHDMNGTLLSTDNGTSPVCIKDYAASEYLIAREEPTYREQHFNSVPVRVIVDTQGKIRHVHFLSAYPDQAKSISDALSRWRFKPYLLNGRPTEVETGILFGRSTARTSQVFR